MYHWESIEIKGYFEKTQEGWLIAVKRPPVAPEKLQGRKVTVKGTHGEVPRRLGQLLPGVGDVSYYRPWPGQEDFCPPCNVQEQLRALYLQDDATRALSVRDLRQRLKSIAGIERAMRGCAGTPIEMWCAWALDALDDVLLALVAAGITERLPANAFAPANPAKVAKFINDFKNSNKCFT